MAMSKEELLKAKMEKQKKGGQTAFELGSKPLVDTRTPVEPETAVVPEAQNEDLDAYAAPVGTQGRKGQKTPRMNLAIPEDVYEYIRRESRRAGMTYSEFICAVMRQRRDNSK